MRRLAARLLLAGTLTAVPALAASDAILYATAASENRVDGFRLNCHGALSTVATTHVDTGPNPRRIVVGTFATAQVLYVAENDRVQAFGIKANGQLEQQPLGQTKVLTTQNDPPMDVRDIAVAGNTLYVIQRAYQRIAAYPLDSSTGAFVGERTFTSCAQGPSRSGFANLTVRNGLLYVSANRFPGRMDVFRLAADGTILGREAKCVGGSNAGDTCTGDGDCTDGGTCGTDTFLPVTPDQCTTPRGGTRPPATVPSSQRKNLNGPKAFQLSDDGFLYVVERVSGRISGFKLMADGNFEPPTLDGNRRRPQRRDSKTRPITAYENLVLRGRTILASQFSRGRVDAFKLDDDGSLPRHAKKSTAENVRMTPVRLLAPANENMLYVATGAFDRVVSYRLNPGDGMLADRIPASQTDEDKDSFPNDVAVAVLSAACAEQ